MDPTVRRGRLDNGLSYFVKQNSNPSGQAEFYIVQKVGSILEEENQRGLAHFLEHMAFNGTKHFPGNSLVSYLEQNGVKFGVNLNAYTSFDETVYNISNVPISREGLIDSCLLILYDWSCAITLLEESIEKERGVIREEMRTISGAQLRLLEKQLLEIMPNSKYPFRLPIGLLDVVNNFSVRELEDYYNKWYRPDLQGIIVVGDFDPAQLEDKIIELFSTIPKPIAPAERVWQAIQENEGIVAKVITDPEAGTTEISLMYAQDVMPRGIKSSKEGLINDFMNKMVTYIVIGK